ncbi:MAG: universal stress protein [Planctomycetales bacterium]|nr:universal stress protein [Planctomycetales bacterium]
MKISQILLTTDFSDHARTAYGCAADLASKLNARLHLVHFVGAIPFASAIPRFADTTEREPLFDSLENALAEEASEHSAFGGIDIQPRLQRHRWTRSRQRLLERELDIDLIVMSPQGRTGLSKMLLGSFADRVVRHSLVPVLLFRPTESTETLDPRTILVPHDFYDRPQTILPAMRWLAGRFNCKFRFLHVYDPSWANSQSVRGIGQQFAQALKSTSSLSIEERFTKLVDEDLQGLDVTLETAHGIPSQQVVHRANQVSVDLVLLGKREGLGSVARSVTREAKCSVLTVPVIDAEE